MERQDMKTAEREKMIRRGRDCSRKQ